jgi:hypothetical protein
MRYQSREAEGTQSPVETLDRRGGAGREFAVLFVEAVRSLPFGARIVSGQLYRSDQAGLDFSATLTTIALYDSSLQWLEACAGPPASRRPPSSLVQHRTSLRRYVRDTLPVGDIAGSGVSRSGSARPSDLKSFTTGLSCCAAMLGSPALIGGPGAGAAVPWTLGCPRGLCLRLCRRLRAFRGDDLELTWFAARGISTPRRRRFGRFGQIERFAAIRTVELFTVQVVKWQCAVFVLACPLEATRLVCSHAGPSFDGSIG